MSVNVYGRTQEVNGGDNHNGGGIADLDLSGKLSRDGSLAMIGDLNMANFNIKGLKDPVLPNDACTRYYVDSFNNGKVLRDGTLPMTGDLNMDNFGIKRLKAPAIGTDASTKSYVDNTNAETKNKFATDFNTKVSKDGSSVMSGNLQMGNFGITGLKNPALGNDACTKTYVDNADNAKVSIDGSSVMSGNLQMGNFGITGLKNPTLGNDACTKTYVDNTDSAKVSIDGSIAMTGNLIMTNFNIKALKEPVLGSDASTKTYVDTKNSETNAIIEAKLDDKISKDGSVHMTGALIMSNFNINGLKEPVLDSDACTKKYADNKVLRDGSLHITGNLNMNNFSIMELKTPLSDYDAANKTYVDSANVAKVSRDGSLRMTGDLKMGNFGITELKIPSFDYEAANKTYVDTEIRTSSAVLAIELTNKISRDGSITMTGDLDMGNSNIKGLREPTLGNHACTKTYVDNLNIGKKCHVGYIPHLSIDIANKNGFTPSASHQLNNDYASNYPFSTETKEWRVNDNVMNNFWIKIQCPERVKIWRFALRGCQNTLARISTWRFEGSNDDVNYTIIYDAANIYITNNLRMYDVSPDIAYRYYRVFVVQASGPSSGLSYFQIFVYSD